MNIVFPYMARWKAVNWTRYHQILTRLAEDGHHIFVLQPPRASIAETNFEEIEIEVPENIRLIEVPVSPTFWQRRLPFDKLMKKGYISIKSKKLIRQLIKEKSIDVILIYNIPQYGFLTFRNVIRIFDFADDYIAMLKHELGKFAIPPLLKAADMVLNRMMRKSDLVFVVSNVLAGQYRQHALHVLPNGVDLSKYKRGIGKQIKDRFPKPVIGFIGAFEYFINFDLIVGLAIILPQYMFLMVGGGRRLEEVRGKAREYKLENIEFTGGLPHPVLMQYVDAMDVCLNTFTKDPISHGACPIKLFEYMAMGKPVISTRVKEVELIDNGAIYFADSVDESRLAVEQIMNNEAETKRKISLGRKLVEEKYNWEKISAEFIDIIEHKAKAE